MTDALGPAHLADVDQAFETGFDLDESTERSQVGDLSFDLLADVVVDQNLVPRVGDELLHRQVDALALQVHVKHFDADLVTHRDDVTGMVETAMGQFAAVHQSVDATEVDEGAEVGDFHDLTLDRKSTRLNSSH